MAAPLSVSRRPSRIIANFSVASGPAGGRPGFAGEPGAGGPVPGTAGRAAI